MVEVTASPGTAVLCLRGPGSTGWVGLDRQPVAGPRRDPEAELQRLLVRYMGCWASIYICPRPCAPGIPDPAKPEPRPQEGGVGVPSTRPRLEAAAMTHSAAACKKTASIDKIPRMPIGRNSNAARSSAPRRLLDWTVTRITGKTPPAAAVQRRTARRSTTAPIELQTAPDIVHGRKGHPPRAAPGNAAPSGHARDFTKAITARSPPTG